MRVSDGEERENETRVAGVHCSLGKGVLCDSRAASGVHGATPTPDQGRHMPEQDTLGQICEWMAPAGGP